MSFPTFSEFFRALWGYDPFPWQAALAEQVQRGVWPDYLAVPTGSGKTACLDIAVYTLAVQATMPPEQRTVGRRIFFIVNRRVIVDEAFSRAEKIKRLLDSTDSAPAIRTIAEALRSLSPNDPENAPPLDVVQLRGAIYRDNRWARSLTQPTIVASTVDQVGSRLLFRGYGLSQGARPLHAALVANDSLLLLDEAHISRPFAQTLERVRQYRKISGSPSDSTGFPLPFHFTQMTATPPAQAEEKPERIARLTDADRNHAMLGRRLRATKPARLLLAQNIKGNKATDALAKALVEQAETILDDTRPASLAIMVNRVATAREVDALIRKKRKGATVSLMIGRMRPIDRDEITAEVTEALKTGRADPGTGGSPEKPVHIVVATQCLEVGADLDFDALVTECASLDALRQRFGRLNRDGRAIPATAVILMRGDSVETSEKKLCDLDTKRAPLDPIYGNATSRTWNWLQTVATDGRVDFGIERMEQNIEDLSPDAIENLSSPTQDAPVLFPTYLDAWVQTNPNPAPDPDPAIFLHGPKSGQPEIQICWRADLPDDPVSDQWLQAISLCPPSTPEVLNVPLSLFRNWFFQKPKLKDDTSDLLNETPPEEEAPQRNQLPQARATAFNWRGLRDSNGRGSRNSHFVNSPNDLRPGDTLVLPVTAGGWSLLGHLPDAPADPAKLDEEKQPALTEIASVDRGSEAYRTSRDREILRLHPAFLPLTEKDDPLKPLLDWVVDENSVRRIPEIELLLREAIESPSIDVTFRTRIQNLINKGFSHTRYAGNRSVVLISRKRLEQTRATLLPMGDEDDALSSNQREEPVFLGDHTTHVFEKLEASLGNLPLDTYRESLLAAAYLHDWGKLDDRFQALLLRGDLNAVGALPEPIAKSSSLSLTAHERHLARQRCGLPSGFRHEMLSVQLAETNAGRPHLPKDSDAADLTLHLIASHHGYARPFAPVVDDPDPPEVESVHVNGSSTPSLTTPNRLTCPPHRIDSGIAERFWSLTRRHGWWGLAYLETTLRLADQQASEEEANPKPEMAASEIPS